MKQVSVKLALEAINLLKKAEEKTEMAGFSATKIREAFNLLLDDLCDYSKKETK